MTAGSAEPQRLPPPPAPVMASAGARKTRYFSHVPHGPLTLKGRIYSKQKNADSLFFLSIENPIMHF